MRAQATPGGRAGTPPPPPPIGVGLGWGPLPQLPTTDTMLLSSVTAPVRAKVAPPLRAPVLRVMLARARMLPLKSVLVPSVAELPTCQKAPQACPPLMKAT